MRKFRSICLASPGILQGKCRALLCIASTTLAAPALADQPLPVPPVTTCSLSGSVCATRTPTGVTVWRKQPGGRKKHLWRTASRGTVFQVADDGLSLVEIQPWTNLVPRDATAATTIFYFHRPGARPVRVTLGEMIRNVSALPDTVSHKSWARTLGYDGRGYFAVDTVEGRQILFDPRTGRPLALSPSPAPPSRSHRPPRGSH